jgi:hypothetical protein
MMPQVATLCRDADAIVRATAQAPQSRSNLQTRQREQTTLRERVVLSGMGHLVSAPITTAFVRSLHNDDVKGLERMARHHALAYRQWQRQLEEVHRLLTQRMQKSTQRTVPIFTGSLAAHSG